MTRLRPATPADVPAMAEILQEWLDATAWMPALHDLSETEQFLARLQSETKITVAEIEQADAPAVTGFLSLDGAEIPALYVAHSARCAGIGSALLGAAQEARPHLALWTFKANGRARRFYRCHGFREVGTTDGSENAERLPDVRLEWSRQ
ncbi:GNAT family N-acetyltransferase [Tropicimonas marinistellae]|uniref:GNAT family N-acetyltransferase n=1 Tax=Tropicimonas marinistellae TaxID=1739787 RepID=UPI00082E5203|nr:GNAT family N-acetyltransferase [Tropicimonas marinistellae]